MEKHHRKLCEVLIGVLKEQNPGLFSSIAQPQDRFLAAEINDEILYNPIWKYSSRFFKLSNKYAASVSLIFKAKVHSAKSLSTLE
jgi:hypothetical protein